MQWVKCGVVIIHLSFGRISSGSVPTFSLVLCERTFAASFFSPSIFKKKVTSSLWLWSSEKFFLSHLF